MIKTEEILIEFLQNNGFKIWSKITDHYIVINLASYKNPVFCDIYINTGDKLTIYYNLDKYQWSEINLKNPNSLQNLLKLLNDLKSELKGLA